MQARGLSPLDVMKSMDDYNVFLPTGDVKLGDTDFAIDSNSMFRDIEHMGDIPLSSDRKGNAAYLRDVATPEDSAFIQTDIVRVNGRREVYIPIFRQLGASTLPRGRYAEGRRSRTWRSGSRGRTSTSRS